MEMSEYEVRENYRQLKFNLFDRAENTDKTYRMFKEMGRDDLALQSLEANQQLEAVIYESNLMEAYDFYCNMGKEDK